MNNVFPDNGFGYIVKPSIALKDEDDKVISSKERATTCGIVTFFATRTIIEYGVYGIILGFVT
jgi:hypothetical protein